MLNQFLRCAFLAMALGPVSAYVTAAPIDVKNSTVKATFSQFNVPVTGDFKQFSGDIQFDPAKPDATKAQLSVLTSSYDLGDALYNKEVAGKDWFDSKNHPNGVFKLSSVKPAAGGGSGAFTATGELTLRGKTKALQFPVKLTSGPKSHVFSGDVTIKRLEFGIGQGDWADTALVADNVKIEFKMSLPK
ncbi:MAG: YceI family protein [Limnobacter sp.]|nr:YceI family protein [Limnobacter sp.]